MSDQQVVGGFAVVLDGPPDGPRILLLHGFPQDHTSWDLVVARLAAAGWRCARFDQRGYTAAVRPEDISGYQLPELVGDVRQVLDGLEWDDAVVVAHDWGAAVAWELAADHPDRVSRLVAVSLPHPAAFSGALLGDRDQQRRSAYIGLFRVEGKAEDVLLADASAALRAIYSGIDARQAERYVERFSDRATLSAALAWYRAMDAGTMAAVAPVSVPTVFVWGAEDPAVGRTAAESCTEFVTGRYRFVELSGTGHWVPETAPDAVVDAVTSA